MKDYLYGGPQGFPGTRNKPFKKEQLKGNIRTIKEELMEN